MSLQRAICARLLAGASRLLGRGGARFFAHARILMEFERASGPDICEIDSAILRNGLHSFSYKNQ